MLHRYFFLPLSFIILAFSALPASSAQKQIGAACKGDSASFDWDALAQCNGSLFQKGPLQLGAATTPRYADTKCDAAKAGMIQWTGSAFQGCDGNKWTTLNGSGGGWVSLNAVLHESLSLTTTWQTLDLSPYLGNAQTLVMMKISNSSIALHFRTRPTGMKEGIGYIATYAEFGASGCTIEGKTTSCFLLVETNENGQIDMNGEGIATAQITLVGYVKPAS